MKRTLCLGCALLALLLLSCVKEAPEPIYTPETALPEHREPTFSEETGGILYQYFNDHTCAVISLFPEKVVGKEVTIPELQEGHRVVEVSEGAFRDAALTKVTLPDSVETLGKEAFRGAAITEMVLPAALKTMGDDCFDNCLSLEKVVFPETLEKIPLGAFYGCARLREVILPEGVKEIGEEAFASLPALEKAVLPESLCVIGPYAFWQSGTRELRIRLPQGVKEIGEEAFAGLEERVEGMP